MNTVILGGVVESINKANTMVRVRTSTDNGRVLVRVEAGEGLDFSGFNYQDHIVIIGEVRTRFTYDLASELVERTTVTAVKAKRYRESMGYTAAEVAEALGVK